MLAEHGVFRLVAGNGASQGLPASNVVPGKGRFDDDDRLIVLHHGEINRFAADGSELTVENGRELGLVDVILDDFEMVADLRFILFESIEDRPRLPDKDATVPIKVAAREILFGHGASRLLAKLLHLISSVLNPEP